MSKFNFQESILMNGEELIKLQEGLDKIAKKIYDKYGPEGTYYIIEVLNTLIKNDFDYN